MELTTLSNLPTEILEKIFENFLNDFLVIIKIGNVNRKFKRIIQEICKRKEIEIIMKVSIGESPSFFYGSTIEIYDQNKVREGRKAMQINTKNGLALPEYKTDKDEIEEYPKFYKRNWKFIVRDVIIKYYKYI